MSSSIILTLSFILTTLLGAGLLMLPTATVSGGIPWMDALFTATSALCVTGLSVVDIGTVYTLFGQGVILFLIQVGGLGVMTVSVTIFRLMGRGISLRQRMIIQDVFSRAPREDIIPILKSMLVFTALVESLGAALLTLHWIGEFPLDQALYFGLFHSVSAFCNAGFSLFSENLMGYRGDLLVNLTICGLIVLGGIGFPVVYDLYARFFINRHRRVKLSIQTKTVLLSTGILIAFGAVLFWGLEGDLVLKGASPLEKTLAPLFQSITCRTAGFNTVDISVLSEATLALMILLMFVGASPGSCGGGVKTTTLAIMGALVWARIRGRTGVNLYNKTVPQETVNRCSSLLLLSVGLITVVLFLLLLSGETTAGKVWHQSPRFLPYLFETVSAFGTVGLSMGATLELGDMGKLWIIMMMLIGRVGVLTFSYIVVAPGKGHDIQYAEENLMVG